MFDEHQKKFIKLYSSLTHQHSNALSDWAEMTALSIANGVSLKSSDAWKQREKRYMEIFQRYKKDEFQALCQMYACVVQSLAPIVDSKEHFHFHDCLGELYMSDELTGRSRWDNDVAFTPWHVSKMMAEMSLTDFKMPERGWFSASEPACGTGVMAIALAAALYERKINFQRTLHVTAVDIRAPLAHMAYIQLSLLGIPAIVVHGDTLALKTYSVWETPLHVLGFWDAKLARHRKENSDRNSSVQPRVESDLRPDKPRARSKKNRDKWQFQLNF